MTTPEEVRSFATREVFSTLTKRYETREFSRALWRGMAGSGLFGFLVPSEYGGSGEGPAELLQAIDAFVAGGCDLGLTLSWLDHLIIHTHVINRFGSPEQRDRYLPLLANGERIGALAASEPGSGADPVRMRSSAEFVDGTYRIRGHKIFITNGPVADFIIVLARTGPRPGKEGISAFLVETATAGFKVKEKMDMGFLNTSPHGELLFEDCPVPAMNLLGGIGDGHTRISRAVFGWERFVLLYAIAAHMRSLLDRVIGNVSGRSMSLDTELRRRIATVHVTLEALGEMTGQGVSEALARTSLDGRLMERLLFLGHSFQRWWDDLREIIERAGAPDDPIFRILLQDAGLVQINARLFGMQLERTARILFGEVSDRTEPTSPK